MTDRWQDDPAYAVENSGETVSVKPTLSEDDAKLMAVCRFFYEKVAEYRGKGDRGRSLAMRVIGDWKAAIEGGTGREWAKENAERWRDALRAAGCCPDTGEKILEGDELAAAVGQVFEVVAARAEPSPEPGLPCGPDRAIHDEPKGEGVPEQAALPEVRRMGQ